VPGKICGQDFDADAISRLRQTMERAPVLSQRELVQATQAAAEGRAARHNAGKR